MSDSPDRRPDGPEPRLPRWRQVEAILDEVLDLERGEWSNFLANACQGDPVLRREVESLLSRYPALDEFLAAPALEAAARRTQAEESGLSFEGRRFGAYRIVRELARGGMGWVFLAERADGQFEQRVALKLLRPTLEGGDVARRFEAERRILARLQHPSIARLIDAGLTAEGRPYLVTEYVRGAPIDRHCDARRLPVKARIALFRRVAEAVQYAHRNLIVHRDLKPSNIFVTDDGEVKLLDFGIAKLLDKAGDPRAAPTTGAGRRWMTAGYAAPEQITGQPVTTATDIYQLGIILYELLSGRHPFESNADTLHLLEAAVLRSDPERPSLALTRGATGEDGPSGPEAAPEEIARARSVQPAELRRVVRGDLDAIALKALRREPDDRYASVQALADDLARHDRGRPIAARRGTLWYRIRKFVRRHRAQTIAAAAVVVAVLGGAAITARQAAEARRERDRARAARRDAELALGRTREVTGILMDLLGIADPWEPGLADTAAARALIDLGMARVDSLVGRPMLQADLLDVLARVHASFGRLSEAEALGRRAVALRREVGGPDHPETAASLASLAEVLWLSGRYREAEAMLRQALDMQVRYLGHDHPEVARTLSRLAVRTASGDLAEAESLYARALEIRRASLGSDHPLVAESLMSLGRIKRRRGKPAEAEAAYREALELLRETLGPDHPDVAANMIYLADLLRRFRDEDARAETLYREALAIQRGALGENHPALTHAMGSLASLLSDRGDHDAAERLLRDDLELRRMAFGPEHRAVAQGLGALGDELRRQGRLEEAERLHRQAVALCKRTLGPEHWKVAGSLDGLADVLLEQGRYEEAEKLYRRALDIRREARGERHRGVGVLLGELGRLEARRGDYARAESLYHEALTIVHEGRTEQHPSVRRLKQQLEDLYTEWEGAGDARERGPVRAIGSQESG